MKLFLIPLFLVFTFSATLPSQTKASKRIAPIHWDYILYMDENASGEEKNQLESELLSKGEIHWKTESGSRVGFTSSLTQREIQSLSSSIQKVEAEEETRFFQFNLKRKLKVKQWQNLQSALKQNRIQVLDVEPNNRNPQSLKIKSPILTIQKLFSLPQVGRYLEKIEEIN